MMEGEPPHGGGIVPVEASGPNRAGIVFADVAACRLASATHVSTCDFARKSS